MITGAKLVQRWCQCSAFQKFKLADYTLTLHANYDTTLALHANYDTTYVVHHGVHNEEDKILHSDGNN